MIREPHESVRASLRKLYSLLSPRDRRSAFVLFLLMLVGAMLEVVGVAAVPAFVSAVVDPDRLGQLPLFGDKLSGLADLDSRTLVLGGSIALVVIFGVKNAFLLLNHYLQVRYVTNRRVSIAKELMRTYMRAPYSFFLQRNTSVLLRNVDTEVTTICYSVMNRILELCTKLVILVAVLAFLLIAEPWITMGWIAFLGTVAVTGIVAISGRLRRYGLIQQSNRSVFNQALFQAFGGIKEIRVLGREDYFSGKVMEAVERIARVNRFKMFISRTIPPVSEIVAITGLLVLACVLVLIGRSTESILVTLSLFVVGLVRLREVTSAAISQFADLRYSLVSIDPVHADLALLARSKGHVDRQGATDALVIRQGISLHDAWLRYEGADEFALKGVNIDVPVGKAVGLVGSTGAGKTTAVDTFLGLLQPERGSVLVDGRELREQDLPSWRASVGYVPQSIYLLDDTIRRNIALGIDDEKVDETALADAIRAAQLEAFLDRQPLGLETLVGEAGVRLSGGERQRIGIARALYHRPSLVIFDEATSALDNVTERAIIDAVERLRGERTIIMIAHRLSTVRNCDKLYFLQDGRVEAEGDYEELRQRHHGFRLMASA